MMQDVTTQSSDPARQQLQFQMAAQPEAKKVVCSELPDSILAKIQARLPLVRLVQSRAVCRAWNEGVASPLPALLKERLESRAGAPDCLLFMHGLSESWSKDSEKLSITSWACVYDPESDRWYRLQLPPRLRDGALGDGSTSAQAEIEFPEGSRSAGGALLLSAIHRDVGGSRTVIPILGNPVASWWTRLPKLPWSRLSIRNVMGVWVDAEARRFKLVLLAECAPICRCKKLPVTTFVFDSAIGRWSEQASDMPYGYRAHDAGSQGVFVGDVLYCVARPGESDLLAYDLEEASWSLFEVSMPSDTFVMLFCTLVNVQDRLLCVVLGEELEWGDMGPGVHIWELDCEDMAWTVVDAMPAPMFTHFRGQGRRFPQPCPPDPDQRRHPFRSRVYILGNSLLKVVAGHDCQVYMTHVDLDKVVALDLRRTPGPGAWRWLPSWPYKHINIVQDMSLQCVDPWLEDMSSWQNRVQEL